jgi:hypothetical protein
MDKVQDWKGVPLSLRNEREVNGLWEWPEQILSTMSPWALNRAHKLVTSGPQAVWPPARGSSRVGWGSSTLRPR